MRAEANEFLYHGGHIINSFGEPLAYTLGSILINPIDNGFIFATFIVIGTVANEIRHKRVLTPSRKPTLLDTDYLESLYRNRPF